VVHFFGGQKLGQKRDTFSGIGQHVKFQVLGQIEEHFGQSSGFGELAM
jgi:hypothetical protein